jgi:hypothetical protein
MTDLQAVPIALDASIATTMNSRASNLPNATVIMANVLAHRALEETIAQHRYAGLLQMAGTAHLEKKMSANAARAGRV